MAKYCELVFTTDLISSNQKPIDFRTMVPESAQILVFRFWPTIMSSLLHSKGSMLGSVGCLYHLINLAVCSFSASVGSS